MKTIVDFTEPHAVPWTIVNDGVMGGRSTSDLVPSGEGTGLFSGFVSLENNGGFASARATFQSLDLSSYEGITLRVRGDGRSYQLRFRQDGSFDGVAYQAEFETRPGEWVEIDLPFERFQPTYRGRTPRGAGALDPTRIRQMSFLIGDKKKGPFNLEIAWVRSLTESVGVQSSGQGGRYFLMKVLVTGATGYIGGRLVPLLLAQGHSVRVLVRDSNRLASKPWVGGVEVVQGDVHDASALTRAVGGVDAAYYLVHSMCSGPDFATRDREGAETFVEVARGLRQVIYLGGILPQGGKGQDSKHLRSRAEVGEILRAGLATTEIRAGPIIGSGSASFEMVRYLTERLPAMVAPKWITNAVQPIAVDEVLAYLLGVLGREDTLGIIDVGTDPLSFRDMMLGYAKVRGLPRIIIPLPVLAPGLAALWVGLVTPIPNCLAVPLVRGMVRPILGDMTRSRALFPDIRPRPYLEAVEAALESTRQQNVQTRWSDALGREETFRLQDSEGLVREVRTRLVDASQEEVFRAFSTIGGEKGWLAWDWAWELRGFVDKVLGGPGLRRGRRHPTEVSAGEAVDFWRVEEIEEPSLFRLRAEMKVPGQAWLQWEAKGEKDQTRLIQAALFRPRGFFGWIYWYALYPFHAFIFDALIDAITKEAEEGEARG